MAIVIAKKLVIEIIKGIATQILNYVPTVEFKNKEYFFSGPEGDLFSLSVRNNDDVILYFKRIGVDTHTLYKIASQYDGRYHTDRIIIQ